MMTFPRGNSFHLLSVELLLSTLTGQTNGKLHNQKSPEFRDDLALEWHFIIFHFHHV
jgi:hypothetical protein